MVFLLFILGLKIDAPIDSVVVYADRALVSRATMVYLEKATELSFTDMPGLLDDQTVRIKVSDLEIGEVQVFKGYAKEPHPKVREIENKVKELQIRDRILTDELAVLKDKEKFLQSIVVGASDVISKEVYTGKISPAAWNQGLKFMVDNLLAAKMRSAEIEREKTEVQERMDDLQAELDDVRSTVQNRKIVTFDVHPDKPGNYKIRLEYVVAGAYWRTYYELRAHPSEENIEITYFGKVSQKTAEDWENAKIVLSTAKPAAGTPPDYGPWYIYSYVPTLRGGRDAEGFSMAMQLESRAPAEEVEAPLYESQAVEAGMALWYPLAGKHTLLSGEPEKKMLIGKATLGASFQYFMLPRIEQTAYSTGKMTNTSEYLFLAGEGGTYVGDDFTGKIYLNSVAPGESTTVSFGVDERVKVHRKLVKSKVSSGGLFKKSKNYELSFKNIVRNFHTKDIACMIVDQVPVSQNPDIKVRDVKFDPKPSEENKELGIYYWRVELKPGESFDITVSFTVEAPAEVTIQNLMY